MSRVVFTRLAQHDLDGIFDYIAEHRPNTALNVLSRIREVCEKLLQFPELGQRRSEFAGNYRSFPVQRWIIFYRVVGSDVEIYRVLDGSRDIDSLI